MKKANIVILVDIQNGFAKDGLSLAQGGSLYVPEGETVGAPAADLLRHLKDAVVVLSQDFHPADHISFASNHEGAAPMSEVFLKKGEDGKYHVAPSGADGAFAQTLWPNHCVQGTESALFVDEVMAALPQGLAGKLRLHRPDPVLMGEDARGNSFYVIRKGTKADLDSYGIATENDKLSKTMAPTVFESIAQNLQKADVSEANIYIGGLATNFCVEYSNADLQAHLVPALKAHGIKANVSFLPDISRGIPIAIPDGLWPDLKGTLARMDALGTKAATCDDVKRSSLKSNVTPARRQTLNM